jgi:hypothetical protein
MKELTVNQFSKQTGIARSKIYYQIKINKLKLNNGKINYEDALQLFNSKELEKHNTIHDIDIKHILNTLNLQNLNLQRQLDLAYEREKFYLAELANYRQHLLSKTTLNTPTNKIDIQVKPENNLTDRNEYSQSQMESKRDNQAPLKSCQTINKETSSLNEVENHSISTESIYNPMTSPESESGDTGWIKQKKEMVEQNYDALIGTRLPNQDERELLLNLKRQRKSTAQVAKVTAKKVSIPPTARNPNRKPTNETIADQDDLKKEDHHNSKQ